MRKIKIDEFSNFKFVSGVKFSPDEKKVCFIQSEYDMENNNSKSFLWIYNLDKENKYQLTSLGKESNYEWTDSENIVFIADREEKKDNNNEFEKKTKFYKININGGEAIKFFEVEEKILGFEVLNEKKWIMMKANDLNKDKLEKDQLKEEKDYEVFDEIPFWFNGMGFISKKRTSLTIFDIKTKELEEITDEYTSVQSTDSLNYKIVFLSNTFKNKRDLYNEMSIYDINNKKTEKLISKDEKISISSAYLMTEDKIIFTGSYMKDYGLNENKQFYLYDISSKSFKCITPDFDKSTWSSVGSDVRLGGGKQQVKYKDHLYFVVTELKDANIYKVSLDGKIEPVVKNEGSVDGFDVAKNYIALNGLRGLKGQELYLFKNNEENQITNFNDWILDELELSKPEHIQIETDKNVIIDGWIIKPTNFDKEKKYPAILDIHGGPKTVYSDVFYHEMQYWSNEGYVVFFCNPRGSDGKGNAFADIRGKYGTIDYEDIMKFTDYVLNKYDFIDKEKIGVTGGSYGGFMTNWIIGNTNKFKAAASQRSISNWISMGLTSDIGFYFEEDQIQANPWTDLHKVWDQSPLKNANKVETPTLFIHSDEDYRCYMDEAMQMFTAIKMIGVESKFVLFKGENHELSRSGKPKHRVRRLKEITEWMDKYLK